MIQSKQITESNRKKLDEDIWPTQSLRWGIQLNKFNQIIPLKHICK